MVELSRCQICHKDLPPGRILCGSRHCAFRWQMYSQWGRHFASARPSARVLEDIVIEQVEYHLAIDE